MNLHSLMKRILTFILAVTCISSFSKGQTLDEKERQAFKESKVNVRTKMDYNFVNGKLSLNGRKSSRSVYNTDGKILETKTYNFKGEEATVEKYQYDKHGNRVSYERKSLSGEYKKESEYDEENKLIAEAGYDGSTSFKTIFKYNSKNQITEIAYYSMDQLDEKRVYVYSGNKATVEILKMGKHLTSKLNLVFNDKDQVVSEEVLDLDGNVLEKKTYKYNSGGEVQVEEKFKAGELFYRITYVYNASGELIEVKDFTKGKTEFVKKRYHYDDKGRIIKYEWKRSPDQEYNLKSFKYNDKNVCIEEYTFYPKTDYKLLTKYEYEYR